MAQTTQTMSLDQASMSQKEVESLVATVARYMEATSQEEKEDIASYVAALVFTRQRRLFHVATSLGGYLTDSNPATRARAIDLLANVLSRLTSACLNFQEVQVVSTFFLDRMVERLCLASCLSGLLALVAYQHCDGRLAAKIAEKVLSDVHTQSLAQPLRHQIFSMLKVLLTNHSSALQTVSETFLLGLVQAIDGEKDPRNLLLVFELVPLTMSVMDCHAVLEDLVEITSCYFPITFTPPPGQAHSITRQDLSTALNQCMASTAAFGQYFMPVLLEKLDSALPETQKEVFLSLSVCAPTYGSQFLEPHIADIWAAIQSQVLEEGTPGWVITAALDAWTAVVAEMPDDDVEGSQCISGPYATTVDLAVRECLRFLSAPTSELSATGEGAGRLLVATARGGRQVCRRVCESFAPVLQQQWPLAAQEDAQKVLLETAISWLGASHETWGEVGGAQHMLDHPAMAAGPQFTTLFLDALQQRSSAVSRKLALLGLCALCKLGVLDEPTLLTTAQSLAHAFALEDNADVLQTVAVIGKDFGQSAADIILEHTVLPLLDCVKSGGTQAATLLSTVAGLVAGQPASKVVVERLLTLLEALGTEQDSLSVAIGHTIYSLVKSLPPPNKAEDALLSVDTVVKIAGLVVGGSNDNSSDMIESIGQTLAIVFQKSGPGAQGMLFERLLAMVTLEAGQGEEFKRQTSSSYADVLVIVSAMGSLRPEVAVPPCLPPQLLEVSVHGQTDQISNVAAMGLASWANKTGGGDAVNDVLQSLLEAAQGSQSTQQKAAVRAWAWMTKALVMRGTPEHKEALEQLLQWLEGPLGDTAAEGMSTVMGESTIVLDKNCHAVCKPFYRQRVYTLVLERLKDGHRHTRPEYQHNYLAALAALVPWMSNQALETELPQLMPLLLGLLSTMDSRLKITTLNTLDRMALLSPVLFSGFLDTLVPALLPLMAHDPALRVRQSVLKLVKSLSRLPYQFLHPLRHTILKAVRLALDDKKRLVRQEAVWCANAWEVL